MTSLSNTLWVCDLLDDEYHIVLYCEALNNIRSEFFGEHRWVNDLDDPTDQVELFKLMLNLFNLKHTTKLLERLMEKLYELLYS